MQQRSEETRAHILEAALKLFSKDGYEASGVAQICAAAGVSKGAFYHHFPSKHALFMALLHVWLEALDKQFQAALAGAKDVPDGLVRMAAKASSIFQDAQGQLPMFLEFWAQAARDPLVWQITIAPYRHYQALFAAIIRQGINEGSFSEHDADASARVILAMALGMILQSMLDRDGVAWHQVTQQGMQILVNGLANKEMGPGEPAVQVK
jgi:AcrR family transcriptional regulator